VAIRISRSMGAVTALSEVLEHFIDQRGERGQPHRFGGSEEEGRGQFCALCDLPALQ
jgi:hypothetical protein